MIYLHVEYFENGNSNEEQDSKMLYLVFLAPNTIKQGKNPEYIFS